MTTGLLLGAVKISPADQVITYILIPLCALAGYFIARRTQQLIGVPPWRIPPLVWAVIGGVLLFIGLLIETAARLTTRPGIPPTPDYRHSSFGAPPGPTGPGAMQGSMWPPPGAPWGSTPPPAPGTAVPGVEPPPPPPPPGPPGSEAGSPTNVQSEFPLPVQPGLPGPEGWRPSELGTDGPPPLFGWYADPTGRHEHRYWDGRLWSDKVADNGERSEDPLDG